MEKALTIIGFVEYKEEMENRYYSLFPWAERKVEKSVICTCVNCKNTIKDLIYLED